MSGSATGPNSLPPAYRFVAMGTCVPASLPSGEFWIDVGNRAGPGVLDHHGGTTKARSSCELVLWHYQDWVLALLGRDTPVTLVLHQTPDLDAIGAAWLTRRVLQDGGLPEPLNAIETIVEAVSAHDQGFIVSERLEDNWPLVVRTVLDLDERGASDRTRLEMGMELLDVTLEALAEGRDLVSAARHLLSSEASEYLQSARQQYQADLTQGKVFTVRLPLHEVIPPQMSAIPNRPMGRPMEEKWIQVDGLSLKDPTSPLFKELARNDKAHSPRRRGFSLLLVSWNVSPAGEWPHLYRHVISTDPRTGAHLQGLGRALETLEQQHEDQEGGPLPEGRQRVSPGTGRHGYDVASPWYDGRGHNFTIVDSPSIVVKGKAMIASRLTPVEVLAAVQDYGKR